MDKESIEIRPITLEEMRSNCFCIYSSKTSRGPFYYSKILELIPTVLNSAANKDCRKPHALTT